MNSDDRRSGSADRTVIRANQDAASENRRDDSQANKEPGAPQPELTVFDPGLAHQPLPGWGPQAQPEPGAAADGGFRRPLRYVDSERQSPEDTLLSALQVRYLSSNPILAAGGPVLILLGQVQQNPARIDVAVLERHLLAAIETFDANLRATRIAAEDARMAKFALCETIDDIIGHLPASGASEWMDHRLGARFFQSGSTGTGFFQALNKALAEPEKHLDLLEFMHACMSLGLQGQYRSRQHGGGLERVRADVYAALRHFRPRAVNQLAPIAMHSAPEAAGISARFSLLGLSAVMLLVLASAYLVLRVLVSNETQAVEERLLALHPAEPIVIERSSAVFPIVEDSGGGTQFERIRAALAGEIAARGLILGIRGNFIVLEISSNALFDPGTADLKPSFAPLAERIAATLDRERGAITIVGHTDSLEPQGASDFTSNRDLSLARAKAVQEALAPKLSDPSRLMLEGKGADDPIADNATSEGRAANQRMEIMLVREETP